MTIDSAKTETLPTMTTPDPLPACAPLRLGELVPNFTARSTTGPVSLADFRGRWLVLFSHPGDFTPVCTSEFVAIAKARPQFDALDRSEEHTSELQSLMRISYAVFCLKKQPNYLLATPNT